MDVQEGADKEPCFTVHYIDKQKDDVWKHKYITFHNSDSNIDGTLAIMCEKCRKDHPGRLLVIINPVGGTGKGKAQYTRVVAPLFKLAQMETDVIVSKDPNHPEEIGKTYDFSTVDGVVIVGGDGTFQQLIHTWLPRLQQDAGIDMKDQNKDLKPLTCPIGLIPTGTGNGLAIGQYGCADVATAALHIITGRKTWKHLAGITSGRTHLGFSGIVLANGSWSDMLEGHMDNRWLGPLRVAIGAISLFMRRRREFNIRLEYLPYVSTKDEHPGVMTPYQLEWESIEGRYTGVSCFPGIISQNEATGKLAADARCEGLTMILEKQCGRVKYFSWLYKMKKFQHDMFEPEFITAKRVKAYKLKIVHKDEDEEEEETLPGDKEKENTCRSDGEVRHMKNSELEVRIRPKLLELFGTGAFEFCKI